MKVAAGLVLAGILLGSTAPASSQRSAIHAALDRYAAGDFDAATLSPAALSITAGQFTEQLTAWAPREPIQVHRQRLLVAAFALEVAWNATRTPVDAQNHFPNGVDPTTIMNSERAPWDRTLVRSWKSPFPIISWACAQLSPDGPVGDAERAWWDASIAVLEDELAWRSLIGGGKRPNKEVPVFAPAVREIVDGHLAHARQRLGDGPRLQVANALARTQGSLLRYPHEDSWIVSDHILRDEPARSPQAAGLAKKLLRPLEGRPEVAAEVSLRLGRLALREREWKDALPYFERASTNTDDPFILGMAAYLAGWANERLERLADAAAAYRRALDHIPTLRPAAMRLGALLYLEGRRDAAYKTIDDVVKREPAPTDLTPTDRTMDALSVLERGDARLVPAFIARMRAGLK